ncbi:hypothetical protein [Marixanthomonas spongiae]|uniref:Uncharacterized protein n=1 Tax=Marixanthomonas spongiae TaxID=2174845 RepID=A0A2U0HU75_9FLAO|nr:hypothetical protein [Marixanthomonas spongiae]PVW12395.1 hypothetical protein DDV96_14870 [Marixanthomonas spongiae]
MIKAQSSQKKVISNFLHNQREIDRKIHRRLEKDRAYFSALDFRSNLIDIMDNEYTEVLKTMEDQNLVDMMYTVLNEHSDFVKNNYQHKAEDAIKMLNSFQKFNKVEDDDSCFSLISMIVGNNIRSLISISALDMPGITARLAIFHEILILKQLPKTFIPTFATIIENGR